jgi:poly(beta-D-mannuronate) lyase
MIARTLASPGLLTLALIAAGCSAMPERRLPPAPVATGGTTAPTGGSGGSSPGGDGGSGGAVTSGGSGGAVTSGGSGGTGGTGGQTDTPDAGPMGSADAAPTGNADAGPAGNDLPDCKRTVQVTSAGMLASAVNGAMAGDCLVAADGNYAGFSVTAKGTEAAPIVVKAANRGKAVFNAGRLTFNKAAYVVVSGFNFSGSSGATFADSKGCRVSRGVFKLGGGQWVEATGTADANRVDHNEFGPRDQDGNMVGPTNNSTNTRIDHNYFHDVSPSAGNGRETIRLGCCGAQFDYHDAHNVVENNLLVNCSGEAEIITIKSSSNVFRYNTIRGSAGNISLRAGNKDEIYGNFVFGDGKQGGIRAYENDHKIYDNYIETAQALVINGQGNGHAPLMRAQIVNNTFVGGVQWVGDSGTVFANNIVNGDIKGTMSPGAMYLSNLVSGASPGGAGFKMVDPKLTRVDGIMAIAADSPAVDGATGTYPFVTDDVLGRPRDKADIGAVEASMAPALRRPLTPADVGPDGP